MGSDADVEANTKLKGLEEKLAAVGQNISSRVKVKELADEDEDEEGAIGQGEGGEQAFRQQRVADGNGDAQPRTTGETCANSACNKIDCDTQVRRVLSDVSIFAKTAGIRQFHYLVKAASMQISACPDALGI